LRFGNGFWLGAGLGHGGIGIIGVVGDLVDGGAYDFAPVWRAEGVDVFFLGNGNGLGEGLSEIGEGAGGAGFDVTADDGWEEAADGGVEVVGGEIRSGEEILEIAGEFLGAGGAGLAAGVEITEMRVIGCAGGEAFTTVGESETTERDAVLRTD